MRWSACESTCVSQMTVTTPRLNPVRLPCVGKCSSSKSAMPMRCIWANNSGMSSTRSVRIVNASFISSVYQNLWIASKFTRTVSIDASLDPHDSPYKQIVEDGKKKIRFKGQQPRKGVTHDQH